MDSKILRRTLNFTCFFLSTSLLIACGPTLRSTLDVPTLTGPFKTAGQKATDGAYVYLDNFVDTRLNPAIAVDEGREIKGSGQVSPVVVTGLKKGLSSIGFQFSDTAPVLLAGEIREWVAQVEAGFTSSADAVAVLYVEVLDPANKRVYSGVYKGFASKRAPGLNEADVQSTLKNAMTEAISQIIADRQLISVLASY